MTGLITGEVEAVSWKNRSFKLQDGDWFKLSNDVEVDIKDIKKGQKVTLDYNSSTKEGRTTNWVNLIDIERENSNGHSEEPAPDKPASKIDPRSETPLLGKYESKAQYSTADRKITLLALHKTIAPLCYQEGITGTQEVWDVIASHEAELNRRLGK
jgi:hypothetical protein